MSGGGLTVSAYRCPEKLRTPYVLSFATVEQLDTYYVVVEGDDRMGFGEITPLPGYSEETAQTVEAALAEIAAQLADGATPWEGVAALSHAPFVASGLASALELWQTRGLEGLTKPLPATVPLIALCQASDPAGAATTARDLVDAGYRCLKMKLGDASIDSDIERVRAAAAELPPGATLRLDANQGLAPDDARRVCRAIESEGLPVMLLEQPFGADAWDAHAELARQTDVPLMLDESIRTAADIQRATRCGAKFVKLKLCKHAGVADTAQLVQRARDAGFGIVFGNGVQTALGNHLEAKLHLDLELETASEANGFLKVAAATLKHRMSVANGELTSGGLIAPDADIQDSELMWTISATAPGHRPSNRVRQATS